MRINRLKSSTKFKQIFAKGCKVVTPSFVIYKLENGTPDSSFGVIAAKKIFLRAVDRNYAKRLLRNMARNNNEIISGHDVILVARRKLIESPYKNNLNSFNNSFPIVDKG